MNLLSSDEFARSQKLKPFYKPPGSGNRHMLDYFPSQAPKLFFDMPSGNGAKAKQKRERNAKKEESGVMSNCAACLCGRSAF